MKTRLSFSNFLVAFYVLAATVAPCMTLAQVSVLSPDIHLVLGSAIVADEQAAAGSPLDTLFSPNGLSPSADVDAIHGLPDGEILFSLESYLVLQGIMFRPNDIIRFDGTSWSKELDGRANGIPDGANIDAISMTGNSLLFSLDVSASLGAIPLVTDSDIIAFDGQEFVIALRATDVGIDFAADVDGLHVDDLGRWLLSFDTSGRVGAVSYQDEDLLALEAGSWSMEIDHDNLEWHGVDLDAWSVVFFDDNIFSNGFEQE